MVLPYDVAFEEIEQLQVEALKLQEQPGKIKLIELEPGMRGIQASALLKILSRYCCRTPLTGANHPISRRAIAFALFRVTYNCSAE
jgi:hypothetical protein